MKGVFIAGTDTGIGKTVVSAAVVSLMRDRGIDAVPVKPVQTGCEDRDGRIVAPDLAFCMRMGGLDLTPEAEDSLCPVRLAMPASPHLAAARESTGTSVIELVSAVRELGETHPYLVVEGAGGLMVPLNEREMMLDLATSLELPIVLVARSGLGTINHTLLSLSAIRAAGAEPVAVILNDESSAPDDDIAEDNRRTIGSRGAVSVAGRIPFTAGLETFGPDEFMQFAREHVAGLLDCLEL